MIVRWNRRALGDLRHITEYIAGDNPSAAADFASAVQARVAKLQRFPLLGRTGAFQDTRESVMHRNDIFTHRMRGA